MGLLQIGAENGGILNAVANNSIASALGISQGNISPLTFATKFGAQTIFSASSLPYIIRTNKNFDVIFHWFPKNSQIRSYFSNAFSSSDTDELALFIRKVNMPEIVNQAEGRNEGGNRLGSSISGKGVGVSNRINAFSMDILSTEFSLVDHCFYQWMRETESPYWIYGPNSVNNGGNVSDDYKTVLKDMIGTFNNQNEKGRTLAINSVGGSCIKFPNSNSALISCESLSQLTPFTRADIEIKYYSGNQKELHSVIFYGAFPVAIETMSVDHTGEFKESYRVSFACDSVDIVSPFVGESGSWAGAASDAINNAVGSIGNKVGLELGSNSAKWTAGLHEDILTNYANVWLAKASRILNKTTNKYGDKLTDTLKNVQKKLGV